MTDGVAQYLLAHATERAAEVIRPRRLEAATPAPDRGHEMPL